MRGNKEVGNKEVGVCVYVRVSRWLPCVNPSLFTVGELNSGAATEPATYASTEEL